MKVLNILNGDATLEVFRQTELEGDVLVWREILSEGPVHGQDIGSFFDQRAAWLGEAFGASHSEYQQKVVMEYERLKDCADYGEVILWFEFDLTDQINLLFLLRYFHQNPTPTRVSLICPDRYPGYPFFRGIGELKAEELVQLPQQKVSLSSEDFRIAAEGWKAYTSGDPEQVLAFLTQDLGALAQLEPALKAHLERQPDPEGLNRIDHTLIEIYNSGIKDPPRIFNEFSKVCRIYGMTDLSVAAYLHKLDTDGYIQLQ